MTSQLHESRLMWIHDPHPNQPPRVSGKQAVTKKNNELAPRNNEHTVPRNTNAVNNSDARARAPLGVIPSASCYNSSLPLSSVPTPHSSVCTPVPPGLIYSEKRKRPKCIIQLKALLFPLKEKGIVNIEERLVSGEKLLIPGFPEAEEES